MVWKTLACLAFCELVKKMLGLDDGFMRNNIFNLIHSSAGFSGLVGWN
jgi:hypothetical protein